MGGADLIDQRAGAYHLDQMPVVRFYLCIFFDLMDVSCANCYIVYNMMYPNDLILLEFKTIVSTYLIGRYNYQYLKDISLSKVTYLYIFQSFKIFGDDVNIANLTAQNVELFYV